MPDGDCFVALRAPRNDSLFQQKPALQRDVVVLLPGIAELLLAQHGERAAESSAGAVRHDHVVDESPAAGDERVGEFLAVFLGARFDLAG